MRTHGAAEHVEAFLAELEAHHYAPASRHRARLVLPRMLDHLSRNGVEELHSVTEALLVCFARSLERSRTNRNERLADWTRAAYLGTVRGFFAFLERRGVILDNPAARLPVPRARRLPREIASEAQVRRLLEAPSPWTDLGRRDRAILELLYGTGIRLAECARLDIEDLDAWHARLLVRSGKGRRDRVLPVPCRAASAADVYLREVRPSFVRDPKETALFLAATGRRLSVTRIGECVRWHGRSVGVRVSPHGLRHACATHLLGRGASIRHIQELLGHAHIQTTQLYTRVEAPDLARMVQRCHPRERAWSGKPLSG